MPSQIRLLLAEDEPLTSLATRAALEAGGFSVVVATTGAEAVAILEKSIGELAGVITNVHLGEGPSGCDIATRARQLNHRIAIVYASAHSRRGWAAHRVPNSVVIRKPYAKAQVVTAIAMLLMKSAMNSAVSP